MRFLFPTYAIIYSMKVINLDKEIFEKACTLCEKEFSYEEIFEVLRKEDAVEKQIAILKLENLHSTQDAKLLISHLTGQDGPIREAVAIKINEFLSQNKCEYIDDLSFYSVFVDAVCDVNPNISRSIIDCLPALKKQAELFELLIKKIERIFERIENPDIEQKNFLTVRLFNLYWCLEAVGCLLPVQENFKEKNELLVLLKKSIVFNNYTIDEKVARIITSGVFTKKDVSDVLDKIKNSQNFYVRRYIEG